MVSGGSGALWLVMWKNGSRTCRLMRLRDTLAAVATIALGAVILEGCAHTRGGGMGRGEAPGGRGLCAAFYRSDFYVNPSGSVGVAANGDLLTYSQPSVDCGHRPLPEWRGRSPKL